MQTYRLYFSKTGDAKYLSHLDLNRCFSRAFRRSGLDLWYTQGYNRRPYLLFALPLALGVESFTENLDIRLETNFSEIDFTKRINHSLPKGIKVFDCRYPLMKHSEIAAARYLFDIRDGEYLNAFFSACRTLSVLDEIITEKHGKKGTKNVDIKADILRINCINSTDRLLVDVLVSAGNQANLNPLTLFNKLIEFAGREPEYYRVIRTGMLTHDGKNFE